MALNEKNNISALRWYDNLTEQHHNQWWGYGRVYPLITPAERLLPFQMLVDPLFAEITAFKLVNFQTGSETDILAGMVSAGLNVYNNGIENYTDSSLSEQTIDPVTTTSWGWSFAPANTLFKYIRVQLSLYEPTNEPLNLRAVIKDGRDGAVIATSNDLNIGLSPDTISKLTFTFDEIVTYDTSTTAMWVEIRSDGEFYPYGKNTPTLTYTAEIGRHGAAGDLTTAPSINVGTEAAFDAHTRVWGGVYDYDLICYPGILSHGTSTPVGRYYSRMTVGTKNYYSEVYTIVDDVTKYLKIEYWHRYDFLYDNGHIKYFNPVSYKSVIYFDADIGVAKYLFEDKVSERNGVKMKIHQVSIKAFLFECLAPEYLCDALRVIGMHHDVIITDKNGRVYRVDDFIMTPAPLDPDKHLYKVDIEFRTNTIVVQNGDNVSPLEESVGLGQWMAPNGDFWITPSGEGWEYS
jgi:hypothetical protein